MSARSLLRVGEQLAVHRSHGTRGYAPDSNEPLHGAVVALPLSQGRANVAPTALRQLGNLGQAVPTSGSYRGGVMKTIEERQQ